MVSLEQVRLLEQRVNKAVAKISALKQENSTLREEIGGYQARIQELEQHITQIKDDQTAIEQGILAALGQLDQLEDELTEDAEPGGPAGESEDGEAFAGERVIVEQPADPGGLSGHNAGDPAETDTPADNRRTSAADTGELEIF